MASPRNKRWTTTIGVFAAMLVALTGFVGPAQAATARTATVKVTPTAAKVGTSVTVSGTVTKTPKGALIKIQRRTAATGWVSVVNAATSNTAGAFSTPVAVPAVKGTYFFRTYAPAAGSLAAAYSSSVAIKAVGPATATLTATPSSIGSGASTTLNGSVSPFVQGTVVYIQRLLGTTWTTEATTTVTNEGVFSITRSPTTTSSYRALLPIAGFNASTASAPAVVTVSVANPPTITTTTLPTADKSLAYSTQLTKTGGDGTWSVSAGQLPAGLALSSAGVLSGTPTAGGTANFTVKFTETSTNLTDTQALSLVVTPLPVITSTTPLPDATQGVAYSTQLTKTGKDGTWSLYEGNTLPAGLTLSSTGLISGTTDAVAGTYPVYVLFTETAGGRQAFKALALTVKAGTVTPPTGPTITTTSLPDGDKDVAYSAQLGKTGGDGTWSLQNGSSLPAGLSLSPSGAITGTPTAGGTVNFTVKFTETNGGASATKALSIAISPPPTITTANLPNATQGKAYSTQLAKTGKDGTWSLTNGTTLPAGLTLSASGLIAGTTNVATGTYGVFVVFTETSTSRSVSKALALNVVADVIPPGTVAITTTSLPAADKGLAYSATLTTNGTAGTWSITAGALPAGLTLSAPMGVISGTPTAAGTTNFTVKFVQNGNAATATKALSLTVTPAPAITTNTLPDATRGTAYSATLTKTGKDGTWSVVTNPDVSPTGLPAGLSLNPTTGVISGVPTAVAGTYGVYPVFTETAGGRQVLKALSLKVTGSSVAVTTTEVPDATTGTAYSKQLEKTGLAGTWEQTAGFLPAGVTLSSAGLLAGTPTEAGDFTFRVTFTETASGIADNQNLVLHVSVPGAPVITTTTLPTATVGTAYSATLAATPTGGTWAITVASLPPGLSLNAATGAITGTPVAAEDAIFQVKYTQGGKSNTKLLNLKAVAAPTP